MPFGERRANTTFGQTGGGYANGGTQYVTDSNNGTAPTNSYVILDKNGTQTDPVTGATNTDYRLVEHGYPDDQGPQGDPYDKKGKRRNVPGSEWGKRDSRGYTQWCGLNKETAAGERMYLVTGSGGAKKYWKLDACT